MFIRRKSFVTVQTHTVDLDDVGIPGVGVLFGYASTCILSLLVSRRFRGLLQKVYGGGHLKNSTIDYTKG